MTTGIQLTNGSREVEDRVSEQNPDIPPPVVVADVEGLEELVADGVLAVAACRGVVRVVDVPAEPLYELACPLSARLARRSGKLDKLIRLALDDQPTTDIL